MTPSTRNDGTASPGGAVIGRPETHPSRTAMNPSSITYYDEVTLRPLNVLGALHEPDLVILVVPGHEADAEAGRISSEAPLGRALLRRHSGDTVTIQVGGHSVSMRVLAVKKAEPSAALETAA